MRRLVSLTLISLLPSALLAAPSTALAGPAPGPARAKSAAVPVPPRPGELDGTVQRADGAPVTRFTVNGIRFEDPRGGFHVLVPPLGDFRMVIRSEGFAPTVIHVAGASGKKLRVPEINLGAGEDVIGEVLDAESGQPVVAARVALADPPQLERLRLIRPERLSDATTTGSGGCFLIRRAPRARILLVVYHPDYLPEYVPVDTRAAKPSVLLHRGGTIAGTVLGARGQPLAGASVVAVSDVVGDAQEVQTDPNGRYQIRGLRPGPYLVVARSPQAGGALDPLPAEVQDGTVANIAFLARSTRLRMDLDLDPRGEVREATPSVLAAR